MTEQPRRQHDELRASLSALMDCCPVDQCNPVDCPLFALRKMERREREQWFEALNEADLGYLAAYHYECQNLSFGVSVGAVGHRGGAPGWSTQFLVRLVRYGAG